MQWDEMLIDLLFGDGNYRVMPLSEIKAKYPNAPSGLVKRIHANYEDVYRKIETFADIRPYDFKPTEGRDPLRAFWDFTEAQTGPQPVLREAWVKHLFGKYRTYQSGVIKGPGDR